MDYNLEKPAADNATAKPAEKTGGAKKYKTKIYEQNEMISMLSTGYMLVPKQYWDYIPAGAHIRFLKTGKEELGKRFKPGGYVKTHGEKQNGAEVDKYIVVETSLDKKDKNYISFVIYQKNIEHIWKKYSPEVLIEMQLFSASLAEKKEQITDLKKRVKDLEKIIAIKK